MGIFEDPEQMKWLAEQLGDSVDDNSDIIFHDIDPVYLYYPVGSMVLYIPNKKKFIINSPGTKINNLSDKQIVIGVVLEHLEDNSYIVMYKGFLNKEPFQLSWDQVTSVCHNWDTSPGPVIAKQFSILSSTLNRYLDKNGLPRLKFMLPSNRHFDIISHNIDVIVESMKEMLGENKTNEFQHILSFNKIFCNLNGHIITWEVP